MRLRTFALPLLLAISCVFYLKGATKHADELNQESMAWDQSSYLESAMDLKSSHYRNPTNRNQMPLYPLFLSVLYSPGMSDHVFFERAKAASIVLSLFLLAVVFFVLKRALPGHERWNLFYITMFTVFIFKAPYCQADLLYYTFVLLAFVCMLGVFIKPRTDLAAGAGVFSALAWLTKASNMPMFVTYLATAFLAALNKRAFSKGSIKKKLSYPVMSAALFFIVTGPYLLNSWIHFHNPFYNVNTSFYIWHDSWGQAMEHQRIVADQGHALHELPSEEKMGPLKYLKTHSFWVTGKRFFLGGIETILVSAVSFGYFEYVIGTLLFSLILMIWKWKDFQQRLAKRPFLAGFVMTFFIVQFALCAFYVPIAPGPRFALASFLPLMICLFKLNHELGQKAVLHLGKKRIPVLVWFNSFLSIVLIMDIAQILLKNLYLLPGGG